MQGNDTIPSFTAKRHRVHGMAESAEKICDLVRTQTMGEPIILVGHNGPSGLGARHHDPCGKDFTKKGGKLPHICVCDAPIIVSILAGHGKPRV